MNQILRRHRRDRAGLRPPARAVVSSGLCRSAAAARGGLEGDRRSEPALHHVLRHRLRRRRRARPRSSTRTSTGRASTRSPTTRGRSTGKPARARRPSIASRGSIPASWKYGLGWRGGTPIQKQTRQTHIVNGAHAWYIDGEGGAAGRRAARGCGAVSARSVAQPSGIPQGGAPARRQPEGDLALGTDRDGPRRQRRRAREDARRVDHDARQVPRRGDDQPAEPDPAHQDHGQRAGDRRLQHRARIHRADDVRQREVADRVAFAPGLGRQLPVRQRQHRPQRLRRQVPEGAAERLRRSGARPRCDPQREAGAGRGHGREDGRRRLSAGRGHAQQLHGGVPRLRRGVRGAAERGAQPCGDRGDREAGARQADPLARSAHIRISITSAGCGPTCTSARPSSRIRRRSTSSTATC